MLALQEKAYWKFKRSFLILTLPFICMGCFSLDSRQRILLIKGLAANNSEIQKYIDTREKLLLKLKDDIRADYLRKNLSAGEIIEAYGEPILTKDIKVNGRFIRRFLYRHPTRFFSAEKIYLAFNEESLLEYWEASGTRGPNIKMPSLQDNN